VSSDPTVFESDWRLFTFEVAPVIDYSIRALCGKPYPGHKKGCPKFRSGHIGCPPCAPFFDREFDINLPIYAVVNRFDIKSHMEKLAARNPSWSERQLRCCLYWQATARKRLKEKIGCVLRLEQFKDYESTTCPEAMGVNVSETLEMIGIILEWPPMTVAHQVAIIAKKTEVPAR